MAIYVTALICVFGIACGRILFKICASSLARSGTFFELRTLALLFSALALYGVTTIAWIWVLQKIELNRAYPLMALAFVLVPIGGYLFLGEKITYQYLFGVVLIMCGIVVAVRS